MNPTEMISVLGWLCYGAGAIALLVYIIHFAGRQGWKRPWNAAGLFFTALALAQAPTLFRTATDIPELRAAVIVTISLIAAVGLQALTALRKRKVQNGAGAEAAFK